MVERRIELDRRYRRKKKMKKLKAKLTTAAGPDREKLLYKIRRMSPFWTDAAAPPAATAEAPAAEPKPEKKKAPPKPKAEKKPAQ